MIAQANLFTGPGAAEVAAHALFDAGVILLIGAGVAAAHVFERPPRVLRRLLPVAWTLAAVGAGMIAILRSRDIGDLGVFLGTPLGRAAVVRFAGLLIAHESMMVTLLAGQRIARRAAIGVIAGGAVAAFGHTLSSHAGIGAAAAIKVVVQSLHLIALGAWIGGLAATLAAARGEPDEGKARAIERFSAIAGAAILVVVATGVLRAVNEIGGIQPLVRTGYGRLVLVKSQLLILIAGLGATNRLRHVPAARRSLRGLRRAGSAEVAVAIVVIGLSGVLAGTAPGREVYAAQIKVPERPVSALRIPDGPTLYNVDVSDGTSLQVSFDPDEPGETEAHITFFGEDGKELAVDALEVVLAQGGRLDGEPTRYSKGHFIARMVRAAGDVVFEIDATSHAAGRIRARFTLHPG